MTDLPAFMNAMDALALVSQTTPRWKEQFGRVIIEAQACGTPVIGSDSGAIPDVIGGGGIVVPERNPHALAEAIKQLSLNPERARSLGEVGRRQVLQNCTWASVAEQMHGIYQRVLAGSHESVTLSAVAVNR
jgi:glycosyltransferase involved in cell wall biosynthesis